MKAEDLVFKTFEDDKTPELKCCNCSKLAPGKGYLYSEIIIAIDASFIVVLCSDKCERSFKANKFSDTYLKEETSRMKRLHRMQAIKVIGKSKG